MSLLNSRLKCLAGPALMAIVLSAIGCAQTVNKHVGRFTPGDEKIVQAVPYTGVYKVTWTRDSKKNLRSIDGTETLLHKGELAGFETQPDGTLVALAGERRVVIDPIPPDSRYLVWHHKSKRETQFGKEVRRAMEATATVAAGAALVTGAVVADGAMLYLDAKANHEDPCYGRD